MGGKREKGSITVFLSLICMLFLALICTAVESARVQGAKAQTANITGMGNFSVLGEFEKELLDDYEIFSLDGSYGKGSFSIDEVNSHLKTFLTCNTDPKEGIFSAACFDPWKLQLDDSSVKKYALLTDDSGEPFYQQAVDYIKANLGVEAAGLLMHYREDAEKVTKWQDEYEKRKQENESAMADAEKARDEKIKQLESEAEAAGTEAALPQPTVRSNPLKEIAKLSRRSILDIVTGNKAVSGESVSTWSLPSHSWNRKGTMKIKRENAGIVSDAMFREYLLDYFPNYTDEDEEGKLAYQLEYILGGKNSDKSNLKYTVNRLLLIREGMNYLYCSGNGTMNSQAGALAFTLTGFLGIPALTEATKHALLLAWAYGESLIDLRILLDKGKVPLSKTAASWVLTLENMEYLSDILAGGVSGSGSGLEYRDYLRILLNLGGVGKQKMRALDMVQENLRKKDVTSKFKAENCIVGIETETKWTIKPVFFSLAQAVMGIRGENVRVTQKGSMLYE